MLFLRGEGEEKIANYKRWEVVELLGGEKTANEASGSEKTDKLNLFTGFQSLHGGK